MEKVKYAGKIVLACALTLSGCAREPPSKESYQELPGAFVHATCSKGQSTWMIFDYDGNGVADVISEGRDVFYVAPHFDASCYGITSGSTRIMTRDQVNLATKAMQIDRELSEALNN